MPPTGNKHDWLIYYYLSRTFTVRGTSRCYRWCQYRTWYHTSVTVRTSWSTFPTTGTHFLWMPPQFSISSHQNSGSEFSHSHRSSAAAAAAHMHSVNFHRMLTFPPMPATAISARLLKPAGGPPSHFAWSHAHHAVHATWHMHATCYSRPKYAFVGRTHRLCDCEASHAVQYYYYCSGRRYCHSMVWKPKLTTIVVATLKGLEPHIMATLKGLEPHIMATHTEWMKAFTWT